MANRGELHTTRLTSARGIRHYFFNLKQDRAGSLFLTIAESTRKPDGEFIRNELFVYEEDLDDFLDNLNSSREFMQDIKKSTQRPPRPQYESRGPRERGPDESRPREQDES